MDKSDPSYKGQSGYNAAMLAIYDVWVLKFMTKAVWKVPVALGVDRYRQHMGHRNLDVGPGTGYFIETADPPRGTEITLLDPNTTVLRHVAKRLKERLQGNHTKPALAFLRAANKLGDFDNVDDTAEGLRRILEMSFSAVDVDVVGSAALFAAARPRSRS